MKKILTDAVMFYVLAMILMAIFYMTGKALFMIFMGVDTLRNFGEGGL